MSDLALYHKDPREYALKMVEEGAFSKDQVIMSCLKYMTQDQIRHMLFSNEMAPWPCQMPRE